MSHRVQFPGTPWADLVLPREANLSEHLDATNSPVLFGCRTGICGTCLIEVHGEANGQLPPPTQDEADTLEVVAPGNPSARLACQLRLSADIQVKRVKGE